LTAKATPHLEFAPPEPPGMGRAWLVALIAHALLFLALGLATAWKTQPQTLQAEAPIARAFASARARARACAGTPTHTACQTHCAPTSRP